METKDKVLEYTSRAAMRAFVVIGTTIGLQFPRELEARPRINAATKLACLD